ncbi:hypothetical protein [Streptomyces sp. NPDC001307]|uniref:hypothetical protein n=1 Tax=Streptomyces sp. NPDC001307 TaxID=3364560 RepID=UPI0036B749AC
MATNAAIGLHRLGRPVAPVTSRGDDLPEALVREHLADTGLAVLRVLSATGRATVAPAYVDDATGSAPYDFLAARALLAQPAPGGAGT